MATPRQSEEVRALFCGLICCTRSCHVTCSSSCTEANQCMLAQSPFAPPETHIHETHRYCLYECGRHLVFETSAVAKDVPFGDYFSMETRFDASRSRCYIV